MKYSLVIVVVFLFGISKEINAQWIKTNGPYGADVTSVLIHNGYKFAGTSNGIYRSTMKVSTWELGKASLFGNRIQALVADTKNIYAGTRNGIYVSSDEGISWHQTDLSDRIITELAVKDTLIFAGTVNGILVSSDKGFTWKEIDSGLVSKNVIVLATNQDMIFVSTEYDGLYSSSNNGTDWNKLNFEKNVIFAVGFWGNSIFVSSNDNVVYRSTNLGETWMSSVIGENTNSVINFATWQNKVFAATNYGLYESLDSGKTWQPSSLTKIFIHELFIYDTCFLAGTMQGAYTSLDAGLNWIETNDGLLSGDVTSLASSGSKIFAGTYGFKVFQSTDNGTTWSKYSNGISNAYISGLGLAKDYLLAGTNGGIFRTGVSLDSWMKVSSDYMQTGSRSFILNDNEIFAGSDFGVLQSTDDGKTWKRIDSLQASSYYQVWDVLAFDSTIIAGYNQMGIRKSNDNGLNWNFSNTGLWDYITVSALTSEGQNILAGTSGLGVVLSSDRGKTWFSSKLDSMQILTFQRFGNFVFAGANNGVYRSMDNGLTWNRISQGLDGYFVNDLIINGDYIYAGVNGGAVWKRPLSEITSVSEMKKNELPSDFALSQNYPNPFNPSTTIGYSLPKSSFVTVKVFDILGREVTELVNEEKGAGKYSIHFDGSNLSGGIYFYSIKAGNYRKVKKMILIK